MNPLDEIDRIVKESLREFACAVLDSDWLGKEHDWVNYYAHGYLIKHCVPEGPLHDPAQIAIEVGVGQPPGYYYKAVAARRDLVIWQGPRMSSWDKAWNPVHHPLAIMEWKVRRLGHGFLGLSEEIQWLRRYSIWQKDTLAFAVEVDPHSSPPYLLCIQFFAGTEDLDWLRCEPTAQITN